MRLINKLIILFLVLVIFNSYGTTYAQKNANEKPQKAYKLPPNLKTYLQDKYKDEIDIDRLTSSVIETPQGPRGTLHVAGHIKPKSKVEAASGNKADRARANAKALLADEADLLGLSDLNELHEGKVRTTQGHDGEYTSIYYTRYIEGLQLEGWGVHIGIGPDDSVSFMSANLIPAPSELYQAASKSRLTKDEASALVEKGMKMQGDTKELTIESAHETAIPNPPYVVWTITVERRDPSKKNQLKDEWGYRIDATSGNILSKGKVKRVIVD